MNRKLFKLKWKEELSVGNSTHFRIDSQRKKKLSMFIYSFIAGFSYNY